MTPVFQFILLSLASYRLQRIITEDSWPPSEWLREKVAIRFGKDSSWYDFITCPWCIGTHLTFAVFAISAQYLTVPLPVIQAFAAATLVGALSSYIDA